MRRIVCSLIAMLAMSAFAAKLPQTIDFDQPVAQLVGSIAALSADATSGLPVKFAGKTNAVCKVTGANVAALHVGTCTVEASQAGNTQWLAAPKVLRSFAITLTPPDGIVWTQLPNVGGISSNYTPVVVMGGNQIRVFTNTANGVDGDMWLHVGSWSSVGSPTMVYNTPAGSDDFIRTLGVARGESGTYYAVLYVGPCYGVGCVSGFNPAFATSPDGYNWTYHGRISPFGSNQSSANNLIVDEGRTDDYRFMFWMDIPSGLFLVHSGDGEAWSSDGVNVWPIAGEVPQFVAAARDSWGIYHLIGADRFDGTSNRALRHLYSCTGLPPWHIIEMASDVGATGAKGTNLVWDGPNNVLHALTTGAHYTLEGRSYPCP